MSLFSWLFKNAQPTPISQEEQWQIEEQQRFEEQWELLPAYIEAEQGEAEVVSVIATAIAAGDKPESKFVVKRVLKRNPEAVTLSVIAASLAAQTEESQMAIKKIYKKRNA